MFSFITTNKFEAFKKLLEIEMEFFFGNTTFDWEFVPWKNQHGAGFSFLISLRFFHFDLSVFLDKDRS